MLKVALKKRCNHPKPAHHLSVCDQPTLNTLLCAWDRNHGKRSMSRLSPAVLVSSRREFGEKVGLSGQLGLMLGLSGWNLKTEAEIRRGECFCFSAATPQAAFVYLVS